MKPLLSLLLLSTLWSAAAHAALPALAPLRDAAFDLTITESAASLHLDAGLDGSNVKGEATWVIPLVPGATLADVAALDPVAPDGVTVELVDTADTLYEAIAKGQRQTAVLACLGRPALVIRHAPAAWLAKNPRLTCTLSLPVRDLQGVKLLASPMPVTTVGRVTVDATITAGEPLRTIFSPTHAIAVERPQLTRAQLRYTADAYQPVGDLQLFFVADVDPLGLRVLAHRPKSSDSGFFMLLGQPTGSAEPRPSLPKDLVLALDTSGSMRGAKMEQARAAIEYCLARLNPNDRFNIITFGTEVKRLAPDVVPLNPERRADAQRFIEDAVAMGRTNISGALEAGLAGTADPARVRVMILLTDGTPTAGIQFPEQILARVPDQNASHTHVFAMGVGHDVNIHLLERLVEETGGSTEFVGPDEEIDVKMAALYSRLRDPVLDRVELALGDLKPEAVYPERLPTLFEGTELVVFGRYRLGGPRSVAVTGEAAGKARRFDCAAHLPDAPVPELAFLGPLWAARRIGYFQQQIRLHGENDEFVQEIVRLSREYGIVTEYTAFLAESNVSDVEAMKLVRGKLEQARESKAGKWAFFQAANDGQLMNRTVANSGGNTYVDRQGREQNADATVRIVNGQAFYLRDGRWEQATTTAEQAKAARKVKLMSKEYLDLVRSNRDFAKAQELGGEMLLEVDGQAIMVTV